jgi:hypothetical protein
MMRATGIAGVFVVALALAPISADAQQISACVNNSSGEIKIVAPNAVCKNNEHLLVWNVAGPQGPIGPQGPAGVISSFASVGPLDGPAAIPIDPPGASVPVMYLTDGTSGGMIATTFNGRLLFDASVRLEATTSSAEQIFCWIEVAPSGGSYTRINQVASFIMVGGGGADPQVAMPLTGAVNEPAGTYNARVVCIRNGPDPVVFFAGDMTAIAVVR